MFYLVIDLEMCRVPRDYRNKAYHYAYETIQIGAVLLNEEFKQVGTIREYVHPEHGVIDPFIERLTGIKNRIGDREYKVYAWSESDRNQLLHEITAKQITDDSVDAFMMEDRWVDYQMVFSQRFQLTRRISLEEALGRADIDPKGKFHDGMDDAVNTGLLVEKLEMNPDYQLISYEMPEKPSEHLGSTLGELFAGLNLKLA